MRMLVAMAALYALWLVGHGYIVSCPRAYLEIKE
jgi:hypothetical protein